MQNESKCSSWTSILYKPLLNKWRFLKLNQAQEKNLQTSWKDFGSIDFIVTFSEFPAEVVRAVISIYKEGKWTITNRTNLKQQIWYSLK